MIQAFQQQLPTLGERVYVHETGVIIGDTHLGDDCSVWPGAVIRGDVNQINIGDRTNIQDQSVLHATHKSIYNPVGYSLQIGDDVTIGHRVTCHGCRVGNRVLLGIGSTILDGAVIEDDVIIGAHSLVPQKKHLASGYLYLGSPVKAARCLTETEIEFLAYSAAHYVQLKENYRAG